MFLCVHLTDVCWTSSVSVLSLASRSESAHQTDRQTDRQNAHSICGACVQCVGRFWLLLQWQNMILVCVDTCGHLQSRVSSDVISVCHSAHEAIQQPRSLASLIIFLSVQSAHW